MQKRRSTTSHSSGGLGSILFPPTFPKLQLWAKLCAEGQAMGRSNPCPQIVLSSGVKKKTYKDLSQTDSIHPKRISAPSHLQPAPFLYPLSQQMTPPSIQTASRCPQLLPSPSPFQNHLQLLPIIPSTYFSNMLLLSFPEFPHFCTTDILGQTILCYGGLSYSTVECSAKAWFLHIRSQ